MAQMYDYCSSQCLFPFVKALLFFLRSHGRALAMSRDSIEWIIQDLNFQSGFSSPRYSTPLNIPASSAVCMQKHPCTLKYTPCISPITNSVTENIQPRGLSQNFWEQLQARILNNQQNIPQQKIHVLDWAIFKSFGSTTKPIIIISQQGYCLHRRNNMVIEVLRLCVVISSCQNQENMQKINNKKGF